MSNHRTPFVAVATLAVALLAGSCSEPKQPPEERILVIDGIEIRRDEVAPFLAFIESFRPDIGHKTAVMMVVREHLLPLRIAQRAFAAERQQLRERANALVEVASNVYELEQQTAALQHKRRSNLTRLKARLPVSMFLFDEMARGSVSPPIEVPQGWIVTGCFELYPSQIAMDDYADTLQVGFVTHTAKEWATWYEAEKARIADQCTFVHPDYRDSLPAWIRAPRNP